MNEPTNAIIPRDRLTMYGEAALTMGDMQGLIATIRLISADRKMLEREGRTKAGKGAARLLAGAVRRLCATAAWSEQTARTKVDELEAARGFYDAGRDGLLMIAMIDAAVVLETENWLGTSTRH